MIVLDTNVLSELMAPAPANAIERWIGARSPTSLWTTSITQAEIHFGLRLLPKGKRRERLEAAAETMFRNLFAGRLLSFGSEAAVVYAGIAADRRRRGSPISTLDAQIAAIARVAGATLATRNTEDFVGCGIHVVDPWTERAED